MSLSRLRAGLAVAVTLMPMALLAAACSRAPEQQFLTQFFRAARARDNATVSMMSAVEFDPREQGEVSSFDITSVGEERRTPLDFKSLLEADRQAAAAVDAFRKKRLEFEAANRTALETIMKLDRDKGKLSPAQEAMKAEWDKMRAESLTLQKAMSSAKAAVSALTGPAEASLSQPGQPAFAVEKFQGELISKDVTLNAQVKAPDGQTTQKTLVVTIQRVSGTQDGTQRGGRPIITRIQGA